MYNLPAEQEAVLLKAGHTRTSRSSQGVYGGSTDVKVPVETQERLGLYNYACLQMRCAYAHIPHRWEWCAPGGNNVDV